MKRFYITLIALVLVSFAGWGQTTKTWNGPASGGSWGTAGNWSPNGVPAANDVVIIDGGVSGAINDVPSIVLTGLRIEGNSTVTFNVLNNNDRVVNVSGPGGATPNLIIEAGSTLILEGDNNDDLSLNFNRTGGIGNALASIAGTLRLGQNTVLDWNNGNTLITVTGTIENEDGTIAGSTTNLVFADGSLYSHQRNGSSIPIANWSNGSKIELPGVVSTIPNNINQVFGTLEFNGTLIQNLTVGNTLNVDGDLVINLGASAFRLRMTATNGDQDINLDGDFILNSGTFSLDDGNGGSELRIGGNFIQTNGVLTEAGGGSGIVIFNGTGVQSFSKSGGTITQSVNFVINSGSTVDFGINVLDNTDGSFTLNTGAKVITSHPDGLRSTGNFGSIQSNTRTYSNTADYEFRGASTGNFATTAFGVRDLIINNTSGEVAMGRNFTVSRNLTLENGYITPGANTLLVGTAGNSTSNNNAYVNGQLQKTFNNNSPFTFFVGKASSVGMRAIGLTTNTGSGTSTFTAEFIRDNPNVVVGNTLGSGIARVSGCEYWTLDRSGTGSRGGAVTLSWGANSDCSSGTQYVTNLLTLRVARFDGSSWVDAGANLVGGSTLSEGSISSNAVTSFSPFALASSNQADNPLPVLFDGVRAYGKDGGVHIEWSNLTERDIIRYEVERSANGIDYYPINQQAPKSNRDDKASYNHFDAMPIDGANFYRIRVDEIGGKPVYSKILRVDMGSTKAASFSLYPNPVQGRQLTVSLNGLRQGQYSLQVFNTAGQRVYTTTINNVGAGVTQMIELPAKLKTGMYVTVVSGDGFRESKQFILQ